MTGPAAGNALFFDDAATMEVELLAESMVLAGASDDALLRGANLCLAGDELLQFGRAEQLGARRYRLSHLLRGRRGTEWAMRSEEHTSELQSLMRLSYAVFCLKNKKT